MNQNIKSAILQDSSAETIAAFHEALRQSIRIAFWTMLKHEIESQCGADRKFITGG